VRAASSGRSLLLYNFLKMIKFNKYEARLKRRKKVMENGI